MEFKRIDIDELFEFGGIRWKKVDNGRAARLDSGAVKPFYAELSVVPFDDVSGSPRCDQKESCDGICERPRVGCRS